MATVPKDRDGLLEFFQLRIEGWQSDPDAIGLSEAQADEVAEALQRAQHAQADVDRLRRELAGAIERAGLTDETLRRVGGRAVNTIRAFAEATDDPEVYPRASIPAVRDRRPRPAPPSPGNITAQLRANGVVVVSWEGSVAHGTTYAVWRQVEGPLGSGGMGPIEYVGTVGDTTIEDPSVPPRILGVAYWVRAIRGRKHSQITPSGSLRFTRATGAQAARKAA